MDMILESMTWLLKGLLVLPWLVMPLVPLLLVGVGIGMALAAAGSGFRARYLTEIVKVLLVDDDPGSLFMIQRILKKQKCKVKVVLDGKDAIAELKMAHYDLVFLDYNMPEMNGSEMLTQAELELSDKANVPVIFYSADDIDYGDMQAMNRIKVIDGLTKQMPPLELAKKVNQFIKERSTYFPATPPIN